MDQPRAMLPLGSHASQWHMAAEKSMVLGRTLGQSRVAASESYTS